MSSVEAGRGCGINPCAAVGTQPLPIPSATARAEWGEIYPTKCVRWEIVK